MEENIRQKKYVRKIRKRLVPSLNAMEEVSNEIVRFQREYLKLPQSDEGFFTCLNYKDLTEKARENYNFYEHSLINMEKCVIECGWVMGLTAATADFLSSHGAAITKYTFPIDIVESDIAGLSRLKRNFEYFYKQTMKVLTGRDREKMNKLHRIHWQETWGMRWFAFVHGYEWMLLQLKKVGFSGDVEKLRYYYSKLK